MDWLSKLPTTEVLLAVFILWDIAKMSLFEKNEDLKENTKATLSNSLEIEHLRKDIQLLLLLPNDVNEAHTKIRLLEQRLDGLNKHRNMPIDS